jgi:hypothetical protein
VVKKEDVLDAPGWGRAGQVNETVTVNEKKMMASEKKMTVNALSRNCNGYYLSSLYPQGYKETMGFWWIGVVWYCGIYVGDQ